ncbi:MAG: M56 family metallopeptidase [Lachnospiraceae bacterium]|nr:M56 family metallopeptidase [Lachnospiraceae bacterium]
MSLLQMSFSGAVFITAVVMIRAAAINKLPKKTFLVLWELVMVRLLIPFSIPSVFSVYTLVTHGLSSAALPEVTTDYNMPVVEGVFAATGGMEQPPADILSSVSLWFIVWCAGMIPAALFFVISYLRCLMEFRTALPVRSHYVEKWLEQQTLKRPVLVRQSDRISTPLTYGIFRPVILMPKKTDWKNEKQLQYILTHEYVHIYRYDTVTKLLAACALCVHWFNPFVWVMYRLFNRDIELACDESVIRQFGEKSKSAYSLMLVNMEAAKSGLLPFCNNFSKNAVEERITAIMKMKKTSLFAICIAAMLIVGVTTTFATSAAGSDRESNTVQGTDFSDEEFDKPLSEPDTGRGGRETIEEEQERRKYPNGTEEDYRSLLELKTANYQTRSVADFNMDLLEWANESYERMERINIDIAQQDFSVNLDSDELSFVALTTWLSGVENGKYVQSINTGRKEEDPGCNQYLPSKTAEENGYNAWCDLFYQFSYHIADKETLTVGERDYCIGSMMNGVQDFWNETDLEEMLSMTKDDVISKLKEIAEEYSNDDISITIYEDSVGFEKMDERNRGRRDIYAVERVEHQPL